MKKPYFNLLKTSCLAFGLTLSIANHAIAAKVDLNEEIKIDASRQAADLKNKIFSYIDDVVITQGSLTIKADLVQVVTESSNNEKTYIAKGQPATFEQVLEDGTPIYLQANEIKYQPEKNTVMISGNAELRQEGSKVSGTIITYNFLTEQVQASSDDNARVQTVLQPQNLEKKKLNKKSLDKENQ
ncbi:lipopolysaccharide transport periplasmic protein LptA [Colwellia sp. 1_MG-2023]|uniref:lipopolysaccharide transport periplasmic protein LptA n=1 Tax=Colwellia sp. 1_MG-2023 TaxID=3062649 RepID=UPI0026E26B46|nr:lipopolysaccharide transport periplasmic protein LptA [Colwellia sp. 1_MG-2023]MDO6444790.1 lipopolysaccharide transport periplasmic protein LptA [Colwellia sp. 1_MG-2023]